MPVPMLSTIPGRLLVLRHAMSLSPLLHISRLDSMVIPYALSSCEGGFVSRYNTQKWRCKFTLGVISQFKNTPRFLLGCHILSKTTIHWRLVRGIRRYYHLCHPTKPAESIWVAARWSFIMNSYYCGVNTQKWRCKFALGAWFILLVCVSHLISNRASFDVVLRVTFSPN
jgi:hypothetical protein